MFSALLFLILAGFAIAAFSIALSQSSKADRLSDRISSLEDKQRELKRELEFISAAMRRERGAEPSTVPAEKPKRTAETTPPPLSQVVPPVAAKQSTVEQRMAEGAFDQLESGNSQRTAAPEDIWRAPPLKRQAGFEERLGTRWAVWVGGVALALGGLLLVRYTIEQGLIGPGMRVTLGALLAAALIAAGEWLRRRELKLDIPVIPAAHIPGVLTAAGTVAAFGTVYAAHALYGFIGPSLAFTLLGLVGIATMLASRLHGPSLAGLGLAGSFLAPMLVATEAPSPWPLVVYLAIAAATAYGLASLKGWRWLTCAAAAGAVLWGFVFIGEAFDNRTWIAPAMLHALIQLALAVYYLAFNAHASKGDETGQADITATGIFTMLALLVTGVLIANEGVSPASVVLAAASIALLMYAGLRHVPAMHAVALAGAVALAKFMIWPSEPGSRFDLPTPTENPIYWMFTYPLHAGSFAALALLAGLVIAGFSAQRLLTSPRLQAWSAGTLAGTATLVPLLILIVAYLRMTGYQPSFAFALAGVALAGAFAVAALTFEAREKDAGTPAIRLGTGAFAAAAVAAAALALTFYLEHGYLTVALALGALGTAYMADLKNIPLLRSCVMALGLIVLARVAWDPRIMGEHLGTTPILNWLLFGYGVPAAAFYGAARVLEKRADDTASRLSDALAIVFAGLLAFFQIRHLMHGGDVLAAKTDHVELGLMMLVAIGFAYALMKSGLTKKSRVFELGSLAIGGVAAAGTVVGLLLDQNPYFNGDPVTSYGPITSLSLGYLAPGIAAAFLARHSREVWPKLLQLLAAGLALALVFMFVTLSVRFAYQGADISYLRETSQAELWSYSAAWLALGVAILGYGLWRKMPEARLASAAIVVLTVLKVFLWDMAGLEGALRAFSFIGLGAVLVGIGLVYQRLVFAPGAVEQDVN